ncbi:hypothetical protein EVAR_43653_1 [Eumeta japonica]|uniref:Uncharacterized protein n=1 Tax=Eumeta variegata TaxID=151549 RepID=A0A4C1XW54_EUMVA|nr:hypothetical protein EVAR_43653_1 [Eumeta japonica]
MPRRDLEFKSRKLTSTSRGDEAPRRRKIASSLNTPPLNRGIFKLRATNENGLRCLHNGAGPINAVYTHLCEQAPAWDVKLGKFPVAINVGGRARATRIVRVENDNNIESKQLEAQRGPAIKLYMRAEGRGEAGKVVGEKIRFGRGDTAGRLGIVISVAGNLGLQTRGGPRVALMSPARLRAIRAA